MIPVTSEIQNALENRKAAYWSAKGVKIEKSALVYVCAYCGHRGGTLEKQRNFMVCADPVTCRKRKLKLKTSELEFLAKARAEEEEAR